MTMANFSGNYGLVPENSVFIGPLYWAIDAAFHCAREMVIATFLLNTKVPSSYYF